MTEAVPHFVCAGSETFTAQAFSIQNGSHSSPPINPVLPAIEDLQNEVQDIVTGFETRLRRIKRSGERTFGATPEDIDEEYEHSSTSDETVSILPIEDDTHLDMEEGELPAIPPIIIGRSKEEILSALDRADEFEAQATSVPADQRLEPENVFETSAQEAVEESTVTFAQVHEEL